VSSTNHEASHYAVFSLLLLLLPSFAELSLLNNLLNFQKLYGNLYMFSTQIKLPFSTLIENNKLKDVIFQSSEEGFCALSVRMKSVMKT